MSPRDRLRLTVCGGLTYPLVWLGAVGVAYVAGVTSDAATDTRGLGDAIAGFIVGAGVFSVVWAVVVFITTLRQCQPAALDSRRSGHQCSW